MKHELFKLFRVKKDEVDQEGGPLGIFLGNLTTTPKSISTCDDPSDNSNYLVTLGYTNERSTHNYCIIRKRVPLPIGAALEHVETFVNQMAVGVDGVVCQDVLVDVDEVDMIFLTIK